MIIPDHLHSALLKALTIAIDERVRHLAACDRDDHAERQEARAVRDEIDTMRQAQAALLELVLR